MPTRSDYLAYKRDTNYLLYWAINTSNAIIKSLPSPADDRQTEANVTGHTTVAGFLSMAELIAQHVKTVPSIVLRLFRSAIAARSRAYEEFQKVALLNPAIQPLNASHKHFINALQTAFQLFGGEYGDGNGDDVVDDISEQSIRELVFSNRFSALSVSDDSKNPTDVESGREAPPVNATPRRRSQRKSPPGKGKKGRRGKKSSPKAQEKKALNLDSVPIESYHFIEDRTSYLEAVFALSRLWADLRRCLQGVWRDVAYNGQNSAVAGTMSTSAYSMVKKTEAAIFVDFPDHESYETVMDCLMQGDADNMQGFVDLLLDQDPADPDKLTIDVREYLMAHTYRALLDFIADFQHTRGKPTKSMLAEIRNWDPDFNLQDATPDQRISWRRAYTINWLYDLVNLFASITVQENLFDDEHHILEDVDWSPRGPWDHHRRLFGMNEFAGFVTSLAMQKPRTDVRRKIAPRHVFLLQCAVDAFTVSRGWSLSFRKGHVLQAPPEGFVPKRDIDKFLNRLQINKIPMGFLRAVDMLREEYDEVQARLGADLGDRVRPNLHNRVRGVLKEIQYDFIWFLGQSKYKDGLTGIPPSRFSRTNSNGLWEYSPYLCGVGLMESLELAYLAGMYTWDTVAEPLLLVHLHNMMVKKGHLEADLTLYTVLQKLFQGAFFREGKVPDCDFRSALIWQVNMLKDRHRDSEGSRKKALRQASDVHGWISTELNTHFREKSLLCQYRAAGWDPTRIPEDEVFLGSMLGGLLLSRTTQVSVDPSTGEPRVVDSPIIRRARALGFTDKGLRGMARVSPEEWSARKKSEVAKMQLSPDERRLLAASGDSPCLPGSDADNTQTRPGQLGPSGLLSIIRYDLANDGYGGLPKSGINYIWLASYCSAVFSRVESELKEKGNKTYLKAYEGSGRGTGAERCHFALEALRGEDEECMAVLAHVMTDIKPHVQNFGFWEVEEMGTWQRPARDDEKDMDELLEERACKVM